MGVVMCLMFLIQDPSATEQAPWDTATIGAPCCAVKDEWMVLRAIGAQLAVASLVPERPLSDVSWLLILPEGHVERVSSDLDAAHHEENHLRYHRP
jgi:hypothetical protein